MPKIIEQDGKKYIIIGDKAIPFDEVDASGKPIIKVKSKEVTFPDGRKDVTIFVPCLKVAGNAKLSD